MSEKEYKLNIFDVFSRLFTKKPFNEFEYEHVNLFVLTRMLATIPKLTELALKVSYMSSYCSKKQVIDFLMSVLPKMNKAPFVKMPFYNKKDSEVINRICELFVCSKKDAKVFKTILEEHGYDLTKVFGLNPSSISKMKKRSKK